MARESQKVNLDALIPRQDMAGGEPKNIPEDFTFRHTDLLKKGGMTYAVLRKPDFQRSTSFWTPEKVRDMVIAYIEGETVPGVIVWRSPTSDLFVIDGAHRLSSVIAWINDDYGDGEISRTHYGEAQNPSAAQKAKDLVNESVGSYQDLIAAVNDPTKNPKHQENGRKLLFASIPVQQLKKVSDAASAERSFLKINQQGVILSDTEKWLINSRFCPNAIAARAISLKGTGGAYWERFADEGIRQKISRLGAEVWRLLFDPPLNSGSIKTTDLPIAGTFAIQNALANIFQFVNFANEISTKPPASRAEAEKIVPVDVDGNETITFLQRAKRLASLMSNLSETNYSYSADIHPFVYLYSRQGHHQPTMFLAVAEWLRGYDKSNRMPELAMARARVEDFLLENAFLVQPISRKARGEEKAVRSLKKYLDFITEHFLRNTPPDELLEQIGKHFKVSTVPEPEEDDEGTAPGARIPISVRNSIFIDQELSTSKRCSICNARIPARGWSMDHHIDRKHRGTGARENARATHHACNSAKDKILRLMSGTK